MNTQISIFRREGVDIRVAMLDGKPHFVVADLAVLLGYRDAGNAARLLKDGQKGYAEVSTPGGKQRMLVANEKGMNRLILRSNAPHAEEVQDWITDEVMPSISSTGGYSTARALELPSDYISALEALLTSEKAKLALVEKVTEDAPKVEAYERFIDSSSFIKIEVAARQAGVGRTTAYRLLREAHIIQRWNKSPMQAHAFRFHEVPTTHENSTGETVTDYTTKIRPEHFAWLVATLERLDGHKALEAS